VHDAHAVGGAQGVEGLGHHREGLAKAQRPAVDEVAQRLALEELEHEVGPVVVGARVEHLHDVGVPDGRATVFTSCTKRALTSGCEAYSGLMSFTATRRPEGLWVASKTAPMPPSPIMRKSVYCPATTVPMRSRMWLKAISISARAVRA
jgi:hypothetical protein